MPVRLALLALATFVGSIINSLAGGGSFLTFPSLTGVIRLSDRAANMTNTVGMWPGSASAIWPVRDELRRMPALLVGLFCLVTIVGSVGGAILLKMTRDESFALILPWLMLTATVIFAFSKPIAKWAGRGHGSGHTKGWTALVAAVQFIIGVYGGYFGAGMGVLMLAGLSFVGLQNLHQMNALKVLLSALVNIVASVLFVFSGQIHWPSAGLMAVVSAVGGFVGMHIAKRVPQPVLRACILLVGITLTAAYFMRNYHVGWR